MVGPGDNALTLKLCNCGFFPILIEEAECLPPAGPLPSSRGLANAWHVLLELGSHFSVLGKHFRFSLKPTYSIEENVKFTWIFK